jgi:hypothetical protein
MERLRNYIFAALFVWCAIGANAQGRVCVAGLESNAEYMALVAEEESLTRMLDSVSRSMDQTRQMFRTDTLNRATLGEIILQMEETMFDIRNRQARITGQINSIEQEWILNSLNEGIMMIQEVNSVAYVEDDPPVANLVYNSYFAHNLSPTDCRDVRNAQDREAEIPPLVAEYQANNNRLRLLSSTYNKALDATSAKKIKARFDSLVFENQELDHKIALAWGSIFDTKSYIYNLLMDKNNRTDLMERFTSDLEVVRQDAAEWRDRYASDAITTFTLQKRLITNFEVMVAREIGCELAADSLLQIQESLPMVTNLDLPRVATLRERLFIDYADIKQYISPRYNSKKPIPPLKIYPKGVIYRILLGSFSSEQKPTIFRNVAPIGVERDANDDYRYFAGGFSNESSVRAAVENMRNIGFRKPQPVVWMDGVYVNLATYEDAPKRFFRVEISGIDELSEKAKELIIKVTGSEEITRAGDVFVVGPLDDALQTLRLRTSLAELDENIDVCVSEIIQ